MCCQIKSGVSLFLVEIRVTKNVVRCWRRSRRRANKGNLLALIGQQDDVLVQGGLVLGFNWKCKIDKRWTNFQYLHFLWQSMTLGVSSCFVATSMKIGMIALSSRRSSFLNGQGGDHFSGCFYSWPHCRFFVAHSRFTFIVSSRLRCSQ